MDLKFYTVSDDYVKFLHSFDRRVELHHKDGKPKPYIGVILTVNTYNYFVPLSSPKPKHQSMREDITFMKVMDGEALIAVININNMIPVPDSEFLLYNFAEHSPKHQDLLNKEYNEVKRKSSKLVKNARKLHHLATNYPEDNTRLTKICCDFILLESKCEEYIQEQRKGTAI